MAAKKPVRVVVCLSDLHCGSTYGLLPPGFKTFEGNDAGQNGYQHWLWECWEDATGPWLEKIVGNDPFALVLNGDLCGGVHHGTKEVISPDPQDHLAAAIEAIKPISKRAAAKYVVEGTECHVGNLESALAKQIGAIADSETGKGAWARLSLTVGKTRCIFQHHVSTTGREWLGASGLGIHLANEQLAAARAGETMPRVLCVGHRHVFGEAHVAGGVCVALPPWQGMTRHARKTVPSSRTRPGIVAMDWRDREDGDVPEIHVRTYSAPSPKGAAL